MPVDLVRDAALDVIARVVERGGFLDLAIDRKLRRAKLSDRGRRFMAQLAYGTVRHQRLADHILQPLLHQPLDQLPPPIQHILRMGVFQALFCNSVTFPAMVHTSVDLAKKRGHQGTANLVNAVLKRVPQTLEDAPLPDPEGDRVEYLSIRYSMPPWLVQLWIDEHGAKVAARICAAFERERPQTIRVNTLMLPVESLEKRLEKAGSVIHKVNHIPEALRYVDGPTPHKLKLFSSGHYYVQDDASMLPPHALGPRPGERVLDMCAAPGGKTTHLAALAKGKAFIAACDLQPRKLGLIRENIERLQAPGIHLCAANGTAPPFADGAFSKVLLDAPCSGLGTVRHHPDLKERLKPSDITELAALQRDLLRCALRLCENGGVVVYSVCTFTRAETEGVIDPILEETGAQLEDGPPWQDRWKIATGRYRILPEPEGPDGYFWTRLRKPS